MRPPAPDDLPDLRPIVASDDAAQAVHEVLAQYAESADTSHLGSLTDEELFFRGILGLLDHATASSVDGLRQPGGGAPAPGEVMTFLARQRNVTQLALVPPGEDAEPEACVVAVDEQGGTTVGAVEGDGLVYAGTAPQDVLERSRAWRGAW